MAKLTQVGVIVDTVAILELNSEELKALDALRGYGIDTFLEVFYKSLGRAYLAPHEKGLRSFFEGVAGASGMTKAADECREFLQYTEKERCAGLNATRDAHSHRLTAVRA